MSENMKNSVNNPNMNPEIFPGFQPQQTWQQSDPVAGTFPPMPSLSNVPYPGNAGSVMANGVAVDYRVNHGDTHGALVKPINCDVTMNITNIHDLQSYAQGIVVRFPDFAEGQPFVARVKRPSMLMLAKSGKIPNTLMASANELFAKGGAGMDTDNANMLSDVYSIMKVICEASLIEPSMAELEAAGIELSDDQLMAIFNYTQSGVRALESFRQE